MNELFMVDGLADLLVGDLKTTTPGFTCPGSGHSDTDRLRPAHELQCEICDRSHIRWTKRRGIETLLWVSRLSLLAVGLCVAVTSTSLPIYIYATLLIVLFFGTVLNFDRQAVTRFLMLTVASFGTLAALAYGSVTGTGTTEMPALGAAWFVLGHLVYLLVLISTRARALGSLLPARASLAHSWGATLLAVALLSWIAARLLTSDYPGISALHSKAAPWALGALVITLVTLGIIEAIFTRSIPRVGRVLARPAQIPHFHAPGHPALPSIRGRHGSIERLGSGVLRAVVRATYLLHRSAVRTANGWIRCINALIRAVYTIIDALLRALIRLLIRAQIFVSALWKHAVAIVKCLSIGIIVLARGLGIPVVGLSISAWSILTLANSTTAYVFGADTSILLPVLVWVPVAILCLIAVVAVLAQASYPVLFGQVISTLFERVAIPGMAVFLLTTVALSGLQSALDFVVQRTGLPLSVQLPYHIGPVFWIVLFFGVLIVAFSILASRRAKPADDGSDSSDEYEDGGPRRAVPAISAMFVAVLVLSAVWVAPIARTYAADAGTQLEALNMRALPNADPASVGLAEPATAGQPQPAVEVGSTPEPVAEATAGTEQIVALDEASLAPEPIAFCPPGKQPDFVLGFADLRDAVGDAMGTPIECEHVDPTSGDTLQQTSSGLLDFHNGGSSFSDGWHHWAISDGGVKEWEGDQEPD